MSIFESIKLIEKFEALSRKQGWDDEKNSFLLGRFIVENNHAEALLKFVENVAEEENKRKENNGRGQENLLL